MGTGCQRRAGPEPLSARERRPRPAAAAVPGACPRAGGVVTDDVIRSLAVSQRLLGTTEIVLIHHTDCGLQKITDDEFTREIEAETGIRPPWAVQAFTDAAWDVRESIGRIKASPFLPRKDKIRGFVFDVATGKLNKVR